MPAFGLGAMRGRAGYKATLSPPLRPQAGQVKRKETSSHRWNLERTKRQEEAAKLKPGRLKAPPPSEVTFTPRARREGSGFDVLFLSSFFVRVSFFFFFNLFIPRLFFFFFKGFQAAFSPPPFDIIRKTQL